MERADQDLAFMLQYENIAWYENGAVKILVSADLETIKSRFAARMKGDLPAPVEKMLEKKHGMFDGEPCDFRFHGAHGEADQLITALASLRS